MDTGSQRLLSGKGVATVEVWSVTDVCNPFSGYRTHKVSEKYVHEITL